MTKLSLLWLLAAFSSLHAADPIELKLWPEGAPGKMAPHSQATEDFIRTKAGKSTITDIHEPTITVYRPEKPNGTSVIVAPGGGFVFLSAVHEGTQVCEWLNSIGVTGILLKYRTPTRDEAAPHEKPVQDAAKAIALVREHAKEWKLDPKRVGLLGFSAGGNLLAHIACDRPAASHLPDFGINIYGGGFVDPKQPTRLKKGFSVPADAPPMFVACAHDDGQNPFALTALYLEYKKHKIPAELHLFTKGGHGFGMRKAGNPINTWPQRCAEWMADMGWLSQAAKLDAGIAELDAKLVTLVNPLQARCLDDIPILKRMIDQTKTDMGQAEKAGDQAKVRKLQKKCAEMIKVLKQQEALSISEEELKTLTGKVKQVKQEIADAKAQRESLSSGTGR